MINLARREQDQATIGDTNKVIAAELEAANIPWADVLYTPSGSEVPTTLMGFMRHWVFKRAWSYWIATGPGIPHAKALEFDKTWHSQVRVDGYAGGICPELWFNGLGVGHYHIDTEEGLKAFAALLHEITDPYWPVAGSEGFGRGRWKQ